MRPKPSIESLETVIEPRAVNVVVDRNLEAIRKESDYGIGILELILSNPEQVAGAVQGKNSGLQESVVNIQEIVSGTHKELIQEMSNLREDLGYGILRRDGSISNFIKSESRKVIGSYLSQVKEKFEEIQKLKQAAVQSGSDSDRSAQGETDSTKRSSSADSLDEDITRILDGLSSKDRDALLRQREKDIAKAKQTGAEEERRRVYAQSQAVGVHPIGAHNLAGDTRRADNSPKR